MGYQAPCGTNASPLTRKNLSQLDVSELWIWVISEFSLRNLFPPLPDCGFIIKEEANRVGNITNGMERSGRDFPRNATTELVPGAPPCTTAAPKGPWKQLARSSYLESEQDAQALQHPRSQSCQPSSHRQAFGQAYICTLRQIFLSSTYHQVCFKMLPLLSH